MVLDVSGASSEVNVSSKEESARGHKRVLFETPGFSCLFPWFQVKATVQLLGIATFEKVPVLFDRRLPNTKPLPSLSCKPCSWGQEKNLKAKKSTTPSSYI